MVVVLVERKVVPRLGSVGQFHAPHRGVVRAEPDAPHRPSVGEEAGQLARAGHRQLPGRVRPPVFVLRRLRVVDQTEGVRVRRGVGDPHVPAVGRHAAHDPHSPRDVQASIDEVPVLRAREIRQVVAEDVTAGAVEGLFGDVQPSTVAGDVESLRAQARNILARVAGAVLAGLGAGVVPKLVGEHLGSGIVAHPKRLAVRPYALRVRVLRMQSKIFVLDPFPLNQWSADPQMHVTAAVGADSRRGTSCRHQKSNRVDFYSDGMMPVRTNLDNVRI